jgi:alpha-tubulin suppressor-like RCC1 family protein
VPIVPMPFADAGDTGGAGPGPSDAGNVTADGAPPRPDGEAPAIDAAAAPTCQPLPGWTVAAGRWHTCALSIAGRVSCWGWNGAGQLGDGSHLDSLLPKLVSNLGCATAISVGDTNSCALLVDGTVSCWGDKPGQASQPTLIPGLAGVTAVAAGASDHACVVAAGKVRCWGNNNDGQLGDGTKTRSSLPVAVPDLEGVTALAVGTAHTCAVLGGGGMRCWGRNDSGQLGDGSMKDSSLPVTVMGVASAKTATAGFGHTCALLEDGSARCWGINSANSSIPAPVPGIVGAIALASGGGAGHTCALVGESVKCWGNANGYGQLGTRGTTEYGTPALVLGIAGATAITAGDGHNCAVLGGGPSILCWGQNNQGQLGDGSHLNTATPVPVAF